MARELILEVRQAQPPWRSVLLSDNRGVRVEEPAYNPFGRVVFLIVGSIAYLISKSMVAEGRITIADVPFWLIGIVPFVLFAAYALRRFKGQSNAAIESVWRFSGLSWTLALVAFIVANEMHVIETVRLAVFQQVHQEYYLAFHLATSSVCVGLGLVAATLWLSLRGRARGAKKPKWPTMTGLFVANWALFFVLVFAIPTG